MCEILCFSSQVHLLQRCRTAVQRAEVVTFVHRHGDDGVVGLVVEQTSNHLRALRYHHLVASVKHSWQNPHDALNFETKLNRVGDFYACKEERKKVYLERGNVQEAESLVALPWKKKKIPSQKTSGVGADECTRHRTQGKLWGRLTLRSSLVCDANSWLGQSEDDIFLKDQIMAGMWIRKRVCGRVSNLLFVLWARPGETVISPWIFMQRNSKKDLKILIGGLVSSQNLPLLLSPLFSIVFSLRKKINRQTYNHFLPHN